MALIAGEGGLGKSQIMLWMAAAVSNGSQWPDDAGSVPMGSVLIVTGEDSPETTIVPRLKALGASLDKIRVIRAPQIMVRYKDKEPTILPQFLEDHAYWW